MSILTGYPSGAEILALASRYTEKAGSSATQPQTWIHVTQTEEAAVRAASLFSFWAPKVRTCVLPHLKSLTTSLPTSWDSFHPFLQIMQKSKGVPLMLFCTSDTLWRKVPEALLHPAYLEIHKGQKSVRAPVLAKLEDFCYARTDMVMRPGDYAVRGDLLDVFPAHASLPVRLDFFDDDLEDLRIFDPLTQKTQDKAESLTLTELHPYVYDAHALENARKKYAKVSGGVWEDLRINTGGTLSPIRLLAAPLLVPLKSLLGWLLNFEQESLGISFALDTPRQGIENPRLSESLQPFGGAVTAQDLISDHEEQKKLLASLSNALDFQPGGTPSVRLGSPFGLRDKKDTEAAFQDLKALRQEGPVVLAAHYDEGLERWASFLKTCDANFAIINNKDALATLTPDTFALTKLSLCDRLQGKNPFIWHMVSEQSFWPKIARAQITKRRTKKRTFSSVTGIEISDYVTHTDHGIGRYEGLETLSADGVLHDCLRLAYADGAKLYVPVENMAEVMRYGPQDMEASLDRLGGTSWHARKKKVSEKAQEMAKKLLATAAARTLQKTEGALCGDSEALQNFAAGFPFVETEDQHRAIDETLADLRQMTPMDRLVCGDVGFGKTEVALRAAFMVAASGQQVAMVVPTTLLARQHARTFQKRFEETGLRVGHLSRLVSAKEATRVREGLKNGSIDIVVATHALLARSVQFKHLNLLIIDEEQHFGVAHKEKLKRLKANIHVLTLTATPIPRTLHMAMSDLKSLSLITTPPVDRKAVETTVAPFSPTLLGEVLMKEKAREGQSFVVCPRVTHLSRLQETLRVHAPTLRIGVAHGGIPRGQLEDIMEAFEQGDLDILLSTNIIESGIDIQRANTLIVYRADLFGLSGLYQLRGRVGRGQTQGFAYFLLPEEQQLSKTALRRLEVMQSLDYLGAGFQVASHDMDLRGTGNLVGEEQSGHIREVGVSYYQKLLEEAIQDLKRAKEGAGVLPKVEPHVSYPMSALLPTNYVASLRVRMTLYRQLSCITSVEDVTAIQDEWKDRFGPLPQEAQHMLNVARLKVLAQHAWIEKIEIGSKATALTPAQPFPHPERLLTLMQKGPWLCKLSEGQRILLIRRGALEEHLQEVESFMKEVAD